MVGDGQVTQGSQVMKPNARKVRRIGAGVIIGFAGATADCLTLMTRLETKIEAYPGGRCAGTLSWPVLCVYVCQSLCTCVWLICACVCVFVCVHVFTCPSCARTSACPCVCFYLPLTCLHLMCECVYVSAPAYTYGCTCVCALFVLRVCLCLSLCLWCVKLDRYARA